MDIVKATVDFYVLESLHAELPMQNYAKIHPAMSARLRQDLGKERDRLAGDFALALRDYLFLASCGEARHAQGKRIPTLSGIGGRDDVYAAALDYAPTAANWERLQEVFAQDTWSRGFGGEAWRNICEQAAMYDTLPAIAYVDHVIDLAHNGGCAFNKPVGSVLDFRYLYHYDAKDTYCGQRSKWFSAFLDYKFSAASLALQDACDMNTMLRIHTSGRVKGLVRQFCNVFRLDAPAWLEHYDNGDFCQEYKPCDWHGATLPELQEKSNSRSCGHSHVHTPHSRYGSCDNCGCRLGEDDGYHTDYNTYCKDCFSENYTWCNKCGEATSNENARYIDGSDYCSYCASKIATKCKACRRWHLDRRMYGDLCASCSDNYTTCAQCDDVIAYCDAKQYRDCDYCRCCWHNIVDKPCSACGKAYAPDDLAMDGAGDLYCQHCATVCDSCKTAVEKTRDVFGCKQDHMTPIIFDKVWHRMTIPFVTTFHFGSDALYCRACAAHVGQKGQLVLV